MVVLVSGIGPHSLGSEIAQHLLRSGSKVIGLDVQANGAFENVGANFRFITFDLNPGLGGAVGGLDSQRLREALRSAVSSFGAAVISTLVQSAGVYWSGDFVQASASTRNSIFGVNVMGRVELLHAVMTLNTEYGVPNNQSLTQIDIGSLHGVFLPARRSIYAASKLVGLGLAASLDAGKELRRSIYVAPGPIDTHMLHFNHWVVKSGGSRAFIEGLRSGNPSEYDSVFRNCSDTAFHRLAGPQELQNATTRQFEEYKSHRKAAFSSETGVIDTPECARFVASLMDSNFESGVYVLTRPHGSTLQVRGGPFDRMTLGQIASLSW